MSVREIVDERFYQERPTLRSFSDATLKTCTFEGCYLPGAATPGDWTDIRRIALSDATQINCTLNTCAIEDVTLHNLKRLGSSPLFLWGCAFRRVTLSGRISAIKINRSIDPSADARLQAQWDAHMRAFYDATDWALDISKAVFGGGITFEAIPGDKIRRDPTSQVLIKRTTLEAKDWSQLDYQGTGINYAISWFSSGSQFDSTVIAASLGSKDARKDLAVLNMLRSEGIAEPD